MHQQLSNMLDEYEKNKALLTETHKPNKKECKAENTASEK